MAGPDSDGFSDPEIDDYFLELTKLDQELATNSTAATAAAADEQTGPGPLGAAVEETGCGARGGDSDDANECIDVPKASNDVFGRPARALADDNSPSMSPDIGQPTPAVDERQSLARPPGMKPFVRGPIPKTVQPRSIVDGLGTRTLVRTCFRLGEAIRFGSAWQGMPDNSDILVELYGWLRIALFTRLDG